jgi:hypothetical protein
VENDTFSFYKRKFYFKDADCYGKMVIKKEIRIIKHSLPESEKAIKYTYSFPEYGELYLHLLENKGKVKQDLLNRPSSTKLSNTSPTTSMYEYNEPQNNNRVVKDGVDISTSEEYSESTRNSPIQNQNIPQYNSSYNKIKKVDKYDTVYTSENIQGDKPSQPTKEVEIKDITVSDDEDDEDDLLNLLVEDDKNQPKKKKHTIAEYVHSMDRSRSIYDKKPPPPITDLINSGQYKPNIVPRDLNVVTVDDQQIDDKKRELLYKFETMKKANPSMASTIQSFTIHSNLIEMQKEYELSVRRISLDSSVDTYKKTLMFAFYAIEVFLGKYLKFDMDGFTQHQVSNINVYDKVLIELGEKSYVPSGSSWPVEVQLLGLVVIQTGLFVIVKHGGSNIFNMLAGGNKQHAKQPSKMTGPNLNDYM